MNTLAWQTDPERYDFRHTTTLQYVHLDTVRHANNVAIHGLHMEARIRHQLAVLGPERLFSDDVLLRPRRTVSHFMKETHFPHDVVCASRLIAVSLDTYRLVTGLFQLGECVGVQHSLMGAWHKGLWISLPDDVHDALADHRATNHSLAADWPSAPTEILAAHVDLAKGEILGRYADLDPDGVIGELGVSRYIEQSRANLLRSLERGASTGMLVASVDQTYHRWHHGLSNVHTASGIEDTGNTSFATVGAAMVDEGHLVTARSVMVVIDRKKRRPTPIDHRLHASMGQFSWRT